MYSWNVRTAEYVILRLYSLLQSPIFSFRGLLCFNMRFISILSCFALPVSTIPVDCFLCFCIVPILLLFCRFQPLLGGSSDYIPVVTDTDLLENEKEGSRFLSWSFYLPGLVFSFVPSLAPQVASVFAGKLSNIMRGIAAAIVLAVLVFTLYHEWDSEVKTGAWFIKLSSVYLITSALYFVFALSTLCCQKHIAHTSAGIVLY